MTEVLLWLQPNQVVQGLVVQPAEHAVVVQLHVVPLHLGVVAKEAFLLVDSPSSKSAMKVDTPPQRLKCNHHRHAQHYKMWALGRLCRLLTGDRTTTIRQLGRHHGKPHLLHHKPQLLNQ